MKRFTCGLLILSVAFLTSSGCGKGGGAKSPEDAFKAASEAVNKEDFKVFAAHLTKDSQAVLCAVLIKALPPSALVALEDKAKAEMIDGLLKRHGLSDDEIDKKFAAIDEAEGNKAQTKALIAMGDMVKDRGAFMDDLVKTLKKLAGKDENPLKDLGGGTLKDVKVDGDTAAGKVTKTFDGVEKTEPIHFRKEDGGWKIDFIPELEAKGLDALKG